MEKYGKKVQQLPVDDEEILNSLAHLARCCQCGTVAVWSSPKGEPYYCDACVPRGCSCQGSTTETCVDFALAEEGFELPR